jgi:hypothetical protein
MTMPWKFNLIVTTLTTSAILFVAGAANAGSHPGGAATTATMGGTVQGAGADVAPAAIIEGQGGAPLCRSAMSPEQISRRAS